MSTWVLVTGVIRRKSEFKAEIALSNEISIAKRKRNGEGIDRINKPCVERHRQQETMLYVKNGPPLQRSPLFL